MRISTIAASLLFVMSTASVAAEPPAAGSPSPEVVAARAAVNKSCAGDTEKHCPSKSGHEAMMCLRALDQSKVSAGCNDAMNNLAKLMAPK
jgi:hypothetical protein